MNWTEPLTASIRLALAASLIPSCVLNTCMNTDSQEPIKEFLRNYAVHADRDVEVVYRYRTVHTVVSDITHVQQALVAELRKAARTNAIPLQRMNALIAVLFLQLGWQIRQIAAIMESHRVTITNLVEAQINTPITMQEISVISEVSACTRDDLPRREPLATAWLDIRTPQARMQQSGLSWRKVLMLPPPEIANQLRALAYVSYYVRGNNSSWASQTCSLALDLMIDLLERRGVTGQNVARALDQTPHAIATRLERSRALQSKPGFPDPADNRLHLPMEDIVCLRHGFRRIHDYTTDLGVPVSDLQDYTVFHRRAAQDHQRLLLRVSTPEASEVNRVPVQTITALSTMDLDNHRLMRQLHGMSTSTSTDITGRFRKMADGEFMPLRVTGSQDKMAQVCIDYLLSVQEGSVDLNADYPLARAEVAALVFGIDRYSYPGIASPQEWGNGDLYSEGLLMQAVATYDRDRIGPELGRPGFGCQTYHHIPSDNLDALVHLANHEQSADELAYIQVNTPLDAEDFSRALREFLPTALWNTFQRWEIQGEYQEWPKEFDGHSLLWMCLNRPNYILGMPILPVQRKAIREMSA